MTIVTEDRPTRGCHRILSIDSGEVEDSRLRAESARESLFTYLATNFRSREEPLAVPPRSPPGHPTLLTYYHLSDVVTLLEESGVPKRARDSFFDSLGTKADKTGYVGRTTIFVTLEQRGLLRQVATYCRGGTA